MDGQTRRYYLWRAVDADLARLLARAERRRARAGRRGRCLWWGVGRIPGTAPTRYYYWLLCEEEEVR